MLKGALLVALGALIGWAPQAFDRALERVTLDHERATAKALALTAAELRHASRKLRYQCPSRARRVQPLIFTPGEPL